MTRATALLRLEPAAVTSTRLDGDVTRHPESHFLDLVVDGRSLRSVTAPSGLDLVTALNRPWLPTVTDAVQGFLGQRPDEDLAPGRLALLVCAVDGDLGCGALTAALRVEEAQVSWSDFLWEDGYRDPTPVPQLDRPITFDRRQYAAAFADARSRVAALPDEELAHRGRRFLWPWQWGWTLPPG